MSTFLYRLGRLAYRRKLTVIFCWLLVLLGTGSAAFVLGKPFAASGTIPGTEAQQALDAMTREFPATGSGVTGRLVFRAPPGTKVMSSAAVQDAVRAARRVPGVASVTAPSGRAGTVSADGGTAIAQLVFTAEKADRIAPDTRDAVARVAEDARAMGLTVELGGDAFTELKISVVGPGEAVGVLVTLGVLIIVFRSLRAALIPLVTALIGVAIGVLALLAATSVVTMDSTALILALMLGLAVGVDYALFIVSRHQTQVRAGVEPEESAGLAVGTAGGAVVFAGATVVIALAALAVVRIPFLTVMGLGAAGTVVLAVLIAVTLLPAVLGLMGDRIATSAVPLLRRPLTRGEARIGRRHRVAGRGRARRPTAGRRWASWIVRSRWSVLVAGVLGLGMLAVPAASLRLGLAEDHSDTTAVRAQELIDTGFGPGYSGPLIVLVQGPAGQVAPAAEELRTAIGGLTGIAAVAPPVVGPSGSAAMVTVTPTGGPSSEQTGNLLVDIRHIRAAVEQRTGTEIDVTGTTAVNIDIVAKLSGALPVYCLLVVGLAMLLLTLVFRSLAVPIKAALGFLLSLAASLGALVAVLQWGWLSGPLGIEGTGPVISFLPLLLVGILFGLAMDYEVFLVSQIREEHACGHPAGAAVIGGFERGAKVVTAAAMIMIAVFGSFVFADMQVIKGMGFALAVGVLLDAFVVRMTLVPAALAVLGDHAWWLPAVLRHRLPDLDIEGERLRRRVRPQRLLPPRAFAGAARADLLHREDMP